MESDRLPLSKNTGRGQNEYRCFANGQQLKKNTGRLGSCQRHGIYGDFLANVPSDPTSFHKWLAWIENAERVKGQGLEKLFHGPWKCYLFGSDQIATPIDGKNGPRSQSLFLEIRRTRGSGKTTSSHPARVLSTCAFTWSYWNQHQQYP